jgi:hypothetical protein
MSSDFSQKVREVITGVISIAIAGLALWMLYDTYATSKITTTAQQEVFSRQKDILLLGITLLGTVTGYYLGRVPAEKQADVARDAAAQAIKNESRIKETVRAGLESIDQKRTAAGGAAPGDAVSQEIERLRAILN